VPEVSEARPKSEAARERYGRGLVDCAAVMTDPCAFVLGANPIIWSNDDMQELGAETSLETCLAQARQIGFEGMELGHKFSAGRAAELATILGRFGLGVRIGVVTRRSCSPEMRVRRLTCLRPHLDLLKGVGSSVLVFADVSGAIHGNLQRPLSPAPVPQSQ